MPLPNGANEIEYQIATSGEGPELRVVIQIATVFGAQAPRDLFHDKIDAAMADLVNDFATEFPGHTFDNNYRTYRGQIDHDQQWPSSGCP